jgi:hypothetical protein
MRGLVARYACEKHSSPTQQLLFRKILKRYDEKEVALTISLRKTQLLEAQIEATRKITRKRV